MITPIEAKSIASVLSGSLRVPIAVGDSWAYHFDTKTITYRELDLYKLTELDVVANFLHEAGHAIYSTSPADLSYNGKVTKASHQRKLALMTNVIEDFRIEDLLRGDYPYAIEYLPLYSFKTLHELRYYEDKLRDNKGKVQKYLSFLMACWNYLSYNTIVSKDKDINKRVQKVKAALLEGREANSTQSVSSVIGDKIYPIIKDLLEEFDDQKLQEAEGKGRSLAGVAAVGGSGAGADDMDLQDMVFSLDLYPELRGTITKTTTTLRRVLTDTMFTRYGGRHRSGSQIDATRLYKPRSGDFKVFKRRIDPEHKDYVVMMAVDISGSMADHGGVWNPHFTVVDSGDNESRRLVSSKIVSAVKGVVTLGHVLHNLQIDYGIVAFETSAHLVKPPHEPFSRNRMYLHSKQLREMVWKFGGGTNIRAGLRQSIEAIKHYPSKKIIICLTDGAPDYNSEPKHVLPMADKLGIHVVGVGIGARGVDGVKTHFPHHVLVPDVTDLPVALAKTLKTSLRRRI